MDSQTQNVPHIVEFASPEGAFTVYDSNAPIVETIEVASMAEGIEYAFAFGEEFQVTIRPIDPIS